MGIPPVVMLVGGLAVVAVVVLNVLIGAYERIRGINAARPDQLAEMDQRLARIEATVQSIALELEHANELQRLSAGASDTGRLPLGRQERTFRTPH